MWHVDIDSISSYCWKFGDTLQTLIHMGANHELWHQIYMLMCKQACDQPNRIFWHILTDLGRASNYPPEHGVQYFSQRQRNILKLSEHDPSPLQQTLLQSQTGLCAQLAQLIRSGGVKTCPRRWSGDLRGWHDSDTRSPVEGIQAVQKNIMV